MGSLRIVFCFLLALISSVASAQSQSITNSEPGIYKISDLFQKADIVAVVKILSGDNENYDRAIYKAKIIKTFKGALRGATVYFGPFVGEKLGGEYVVFLRNTSNPVTPKAGKTAGYGTIRYSEVFDQGYSSMESSYACVFDGKEIRQKCDYGVRVCTDYIKLPQSISAFPAEETDPPFGCRWIRKSVFFAFLDTLK